MSIEILTTQEIKDQNLSNLESQLGQTAPVADKAFLRVLAAMEALMIRPLYNYAIERIKQNLALTATGSDLDLLGSEYDVNRTLAEAAQLTATIPGTNGTNIPAGTDFIGDANGVRYLTDALVVVAGGVGTIALTALETGVVGNLQVSDTLKIGTQIAGLESTATVTVIDNVGAEEETDDDYRIRVLDEIRGDGGGGNAFDYRQWAQEVAGVRRAYPIAGKPIELGLESAPPDRTVYVEATEAIDADGIAPQSLLDEVRDTITTDPITGLARQPLGLTDDTLYVESISRLSFDVRVTTLSVSADIIANVKADISTALTTYFKSIQSFVEGLDSLVDRNDLITDLTVSQTVQDVLSANGGTAAEVAFGQAGTGTFISLYQLNAGQLAKLGTVSYV
jgi:uncharacterized phage protein gp47/JayE